MSQDIPSRPDLTGEFRVRFPLPVVVPIVAVAVIAVVTLGYSRVLLSIPEDAATAVALMTAANILIACAFVALRRSMHRVGVLEVALVAAYPIVVAVVIANTGIIGESTAEGEGAAAHQETASGGGADVTLVAQSVAFDTDSISLPAAQDVTVTLDNQDTVPHNFALYETEEDADAQANALFQGDNVDGGASLDYEFTSPEKGDYVFQCDVHPAMRGSAAVE